MRPLLAAFAVSQQVVHSPVPGGIYRSQCRLAILPFGVTVSKSVVTEADVSRVGRIYS